MNQQQRAARAFLQPPVENAVRHARLGRPNHQFNVGPMAVPATITNLLGAARDRVRLWAPVIMENLAPAAYRNNPGYVAYVAAGVVDADDIGMRMNQDRYAHVVVQACAAGYPNDVAATIEESLNRLSRYMTRSWANYPAEVRELLRAAEEGGAPGELPNFDLAAGQLMTGDQMGIILPALADTDVARTSAITIFTTGLIAYAKQGNVTMGFINKVTLALRDELGVNIMIDPSTVQLVWNLMGPWFRPQVAEDVFAAWENAVGAACLRLRLVIQQAAWTGLTNYQTIHQARAAFPDFPWSRLATLIPGEFANFERACVEVGNNPYYGYNADLNFVRSTLYQNLAYCAWCLMSDIGGMRTLRDYKGMNRNTSMSTAIDAMMNTYRAARTAALLDPNLVIGREATRSGARFQALRFGEAVDDGVLNAAANAEVQRVEQAEARAREEAAAAARAEEERARREEERARRNQRGGDGRQGGRGGNNNNNNPFNGED